MKKMIVILCSLVIIVISLFFINRLLNPVENVETIENSTVSYGDYELFNFDTNVNVYSLKDTSNFSIMVQNIDLNYQDGYLLIDECAFDDVLKVYSYFAIYSNSVVVMAYQDSDGYSHVIMYDTFTDELDIVDKIDTFYVNVDEDIIFENLGVIINTSKIFNNKLIGTNSDICDIKDTEMIVTKTFEIYYDPNSKKFTQNEDLYFTNLYTYIANNNLCKE